MSTLSPNTTNFSYPLTGDFAFYGDATDFQDNWTTRFEENWGYLASYSLSMALCLLVMGITVFSKPRINGDYKWFIFNQMISNFFCALGLFLFYTVVYVYIGRIEYIMHYLGSDAPVWMKVFNEIILQEIQVKLGAYGQNLTLFATVFNRWLAVAFPNQYPTIMSPRLKLLYCFLCYLLILPIDVRLFEMLAFSSTSVICLDVGIFLIPWLLSIVLCALTAVVFFRHAHSTGSLLDRRTRNENRAILLCMIIQIVVPLLDKIPGYIIIIISMFQDIPDELREHHWFFIGLSKISHFNEYFSNAYTCLVILITMGPYRRALLSLLFPASIFSKCTSSVHDSEEANVSNEAAKRPRVVHIAAGVY